MMAAWSGGTLARLRQMWAEGITCARIAEALGCSRDAVIGKVHRLGLPPRKPGVGGGPQTRPKTKRAAKTSARAPAGAISGCPALPARPMPASLLASEPPSAASVPIDRCGPGSCRWPLWGAVRLGSLRPQERLVCGRPVAPGKTVYCAAHTARAHLSMPARSAHARGSR